MRASWAVVMLLTTACSDRQDPPAGGNGRQLMAAGNGGQAGTGGSSEQAGTAGTPLAAGAGTGGSAGAVVSENAGAAGTSLTLNPAPSVDLTSCSRVIDDGSTKAPGACFLCCAGVSLINSGFFQGSCACASELADASACAAEPDNDACGTCCTAAGFRRASFDAEAEGDASCACHAHTNEALCAAHGDSPADCSTCCVNAGYVSSSIDGSCVCADG
ncbi:MAG TPA: hypothetical protein VFV94_04490 [Polyangiaceae bacterium]|jgi:hypothetical protein|nr:hypothetical protein [Polyangiaceae bacterium]